MKTKLSKKNNCIISVTISGTIFFLLFVVIGLPFILTLAATLASYSLLFCLLREIYEGKPDTWAYEDLMEYLCEEIKDLDRLKSNLRGTRIDEKVNHLMVISRDIAQFLKRSPNEIYRANTFIVEVLPAALSVLNEYSEFQKNYSNNKIVSFGLANIEHNLDPIISEFNDSYSTIIEGRFSEIQRALDVTNGHCVAGEKNVDTLRAKYQM